jgi:predicted flavoprotein YhiN
MGEIGAKTIKQIINQLTSWKFEVVSTRELQYAEVSGGGVDLEQIDKTTMQSKLVPNLYFCGEVLDVVGQRGGFNLHFAFATGYIAGKNLKKCL